MSSKRGPTPRNSTRMPLMVLHMSFGERMWDSNVCDTLEYDALVNNPAVTAIYQINVHLSKEDQPQRSSHRRHRQMSRLCLCAVPYLDSLGIAINYGNGWVHYVPVQSPAGYSGPSGASPDNDTRNIVDFIGSQGSGTMPDPDNEKLPPFGVHNIALVGKAAGKDVGMWFAPGAIRPCRPGSAPMSRWIDPRHTTACISGAMQRSIRRPCPPAVERMRADHVGPDVPPDRPLP
ncbi:hypothetical protein B0H14DRAFT_2578033 [Mycena olivaceomarginata]|nr:hypothetical protein B0H14DRAFT_2578033 [Mycena olivaceomarginata]